MRTVDQIFYDKPKKDEMVLEQKLEIFSDFIPIIFKKFDVAEHTFHVD